MNRPDRLVIEHRPRSLMLLLAAATAAALAIGVDIAWHGSFWALLPLAAALALACAVRYDFPSHSTITLDRTRGSVEVLWQDDGGTTRRTLPLAEVSRAEVGTIRSHDGPAIRRTSLVAGGTRQQITRAFMSGPGPAQTARTINDWLAR